MITVLALVSNGGLSDDHEGEECPAKGFTVEEETCTRSEQSDMVPRAQLREALEKMQKLDITIQKKDQLMKDIRSRWKYLKRQISDLTDENEELRDYMSKHKEKREEAEEKVAGLRNQLDVLKETVDKITQLVPDVGKDLVHNVWRQGSDLRICREDLEQKERDEVSYKRNLDQFVRDLASMHQMERECAKDLKKCEADLIRVDAQVSTESCKEANKLFDDLKKLDARSDPRGKSHFKDDVFEHEILRALGSCILQASTEGKDVNLLNDDSEKLAKMQEFCGQMKTSLDTCIDDVTNLRNKVERAQFDNKEIAERLELCESWVQILNELSGIRVTNVNELVNQEKTEAEDSERSVEDAQEAESNGDIPTPTLFMAEPEDDAPRPTLYKSDGEIEYLHVIPWKPEEVPDITNMTEKEVRETFAILNQDYMLIFEEAVQSTEQFRICMVQRQDAVIMKYFQTKDLYRTKTKLFETVKEKLQLEDKCSEGGGVAEEKYEYMRDERSKCVLNLKEVKEKATVNMQELKQCREEKTKLEKENEKLGEEAEQHRLNADHFKFLTKGSQKLITEMEQAEVDQTAKLEEQEEELKLAIKGKKELRIFSLMFLYMGPSDREFFSSRG